MKKKFLCVIAGVTMLALAGCQSANKEAGVPKEDAQQTQQEGQKEETDAKGEVVLAAAASLKNVFDKDLIPAFEEKYPDVKITASYDSSGKLMTQIEEGLNADLFFSASPKQMKELIEKEFVKEEDSTNLLENQVVLITQKDSDKTVDSFATLKDVDSISIGDPASVPAGQYAQKILTNAGVWEEVQAKASLGTNVTEVLNQVAQGSADFGIVYGTDAASSPDVKIILTADRQVLPEPAVYPVGMTKNGENRPAAEAFYKFLQSDEAIKTFEKYGFLKYEK